MKIATLLAIVFVTLMPFLLVVLTSLKTKADSVALPPKWLFTPTLENYVEQLANEEFFRAAFNSLVIASATTIIATFIAVFAGYALARYRFRGQGLFAYSFLLIRAVPPIAFVIPYFMIWRDLDWRDTYQAMIVMYLTLALPLMVWMMRSFFVEIPVEIEEAAQVDGCTRLQALRHVLIPNVMPGIVAAAGLSASSSSGTSSCTRSSTPATRPRRCRSRSTSRWATSRPTGPSSRAPLSWPSSRRSSSWGSRSGSSSVV